MNTYLEILRKLTIINTVVIIIMGIWCITLTQELSKTKKMIVPYVPVPEETAETWELEELPELPKI